MGFLGEFNLILPLLFPYISQDEAFKKRQLILFFNIDSKKFLHPTTLLR